MKFHVSDQVIHWTYGLGEIVQLDEKVISEKKALYYVVRIRDLTLWVKADEHGEASLRRPTPGDEFKNLFDILRSPGEALSIDRLERKQHLQDRMRDGKLESVCRVVRDLTSYRLTRKLNDNDKSMLERAQNFLITEWKLSLSVTSTQAEHELARMLAE
jgi:RNA polymerase-interacting CarD/CdnL/TRCF family regulator